MKSLKETTVGEISEIFNKLNNDGSLFRCDLGQIARHFLSEFLPLNLFQADFETIKKSFLENIEFEEFKEKKFNEDELDFMAELHKKQIEVIEKACADESEFYRYICKAYLDLVREPKEELLSAFVRARQDIREIDETLSKIQSQLDEITKNNDVNEIQEKKPILYYYQEHNQKAKEQVLNFLKEEINDYALSNCYDNSIMSGLFGRVPYNYHWNPKSYAPRYPNDLENKFGDLPYQAFVELSKQYKEDKMAFNKYLAEHIEREEIVFNINNLLDKHHILDIRKEIISEALNTYENGAKIMFVNAVPTIIEGILHDICILIGEDENELLQKGFQHKLDRLKNVLSYELCYEYYSFRFRLFRNKVAHGRLTQSDVFELSDLLLLDLYDICKLVSSQKLKLNQKRFVIDEINKNVSTPDYKYVLEFLLLDKIEIPSFYNLDNQVSEVEKIIASSEFWEFIEKEMEGGDISKHGIYTILKIISSRKPFDKRCTSLFKKAGIKNVDKSLADNYLKYLTNNY